MKSAAIQTACLLLALAVLVFVFPGCTARQVPSAKIEFPDMHIEVDPTGKLPANFWDAYSLLNDGNRLFDQKRFDAARAMYLKLIENYPDDDSAPLAWYNAALCLEEMGRFSEALAAYRHFETTYPQAVDPIHLAFRYAYCHENLEQWERAISKLAPIGSAVDATPDQKAQAQARVAISTFRAGRKDAARKMLREAMSRYEDLHKRHITADKYFYAKACFWLGEYYFERYRQVELSGTQDELERTFENKATLFILSRAQYLKAIKTYESDFLFASLHRIGQGYEHFFFSVIEAPLPEDLAPDEKDEYTRILKESTAPALRKAIEVYRNNLRSGASLVQGNPWLKKSKERLAFCEQWQQENL